MRALVAFLTSCCLGVLSAQQQPQFVMPIWFEDSLGNRDTVWVGGDPSASYSNINTQFGEVEITTPFDSIFEVRAVHADDNDWKTSKTIIEGTDAPGQCILPSGTRLMIHAKYPPVKISWDTTILASNYPCNINTILTPDMLVFLLQNWHEARIIYCMMTIDSIAIENLVPFPPPHRLEHPFEVQGQGVKVLPGLWFTGFWDFPHCYTTLPTAEADLEEQIWLSPNPVSRDLRLSNQSGFEIITVRVIALSGQAVYSSPNKNMGEQIDIPMEGLRPGFYFVQIVLGNGRTITRKIVKE
jgi:hypothetical protein